MEHLMNELVGRSIAREREHDLAVGLRLRDAEGQRRTAARRRPRPPGRRPGRVPVVAHA